jgi:hypothetical protein
MIGFDSEPRDWVAHGDAQVARIQQRLWNYKTDSRAATNWPIDQQRTIRAKGQ